MVVSVLAVALSAILVTNFAASADPPEDGNQTDVLAAGNSFLWSHLGNPALGQALQDTYIAEDFEGFISQDTAGVGRIVKLIGPNQPKRVAVKAELFSWDGVEVTLLQTSGLVNSGDAGKSATAITNEMPWTETCEGRFTKTTAQERWSDDRLSTTVREGPTILSPSCYFGGAAAIKKLQLRK